MLVIAHCSVQVHQNGQISLLAAVMLVIAHCSVQVHQNGQISLLAAVILLVIARKCHADDLQVCCELQTSISLRRTPAASVVQPQIELGSMCATLT